MSLFKLLLLACCAVALTEDDDESPPMRAADTFEQHRIAVMSDSFTIWPFIFEYRLALLSINSCTDAMLMCAGSLLHRMQCSITAGVSIFVTPFCSSYHHLVRLMYRYVHVIIIIIID